MQYASPAHIITVFERKINDQRLVVDWLLASLLGSFMQLVTEKVRAERGETKNKRQWPKRCLGKRIKIVTLQNLIRFLWHSVYGPSPKNHDEPSTTALTVAVNLFCCKFVQVIAPL